MTHEPSAGRDDRPAQPDSLDPGGGPIAAAPPPRGTPPDARHVPGPRRWPRGLRVAAWVLLALLLAAPLVIWRDAIAHLFAQRELVVAAIRDAGAWGPLALIGLTIAQVIVAPIPGQAVNFAAGYLFGLGPGLLYAWVGLVAGASLAMLLARYVGRPLVERLVPRELLDKIDRLARGRGLWFFFVFFLIPGLPDDVLCFVAGLTPLPLRALALLSAIARLPGLLVAVWFGAYAERAPWPLWAALAALSAAMLWGWWRYGDRIERKLLGLTGRYGR